MDMEVIHPKTKIIKVIHPSKDVSYNLGYTPTYLGLIHKLYIQRSSLVGDAPMFSTLPLELAASLRHGASGARPRRRSGPRTALGPRRAKLMYPRSHEIP